MSGYGKRDHDLTMAEMAAAKAAVLLSEARSRVVAAQQHDHRWDEGIERIGRRCEDVRDMADEIRVAIRNKRDGVLAPSREAE